MAPAESKFLQCFLAPSRKPIDPNSLEFLTCTIPEGEQVLMEALQTTDKSEDVKAWLREGMNKPGSTLGRDTYNPKVEMEELRKYYYYFHNILFNRMIDVENHDGDDAVTIAMKEKGDESIEKWEAARGAMRGITLGKGEYDMYELRFDVFIWERPAIRDPGDRMTSYVGALLHEMIHAFFRLYCCLCATCKARNGGSDGYGVTGHGLVFQRVAFEMKEFCRKTLLVDLDLGLEDSAAIEHHRSKAPLYRESYEGFGLDVTKIEEKMEGVETGQLKLPSGY